MLNISKYKVTNIAARHDLASMVLLNPRKRNWTTSWVLLGVLGLLLGGLFLPWTQTIWGSGKVTALQPSQRPQALQSAIGGRIDAWYVKEGDYVSKGDTLLFVSEIKSEYFDPALLSRTQSQIDAKGSAVGAYKEKIVALDRRVDALQKSKSLKMEQATNKILQAKLKIMADSIGSEAANLNYSIAEKQFQRINNLYEQGLKSLTETEGRKMKMQSAQADLISAESKLLTSRNELINARVEYVSIGNDYDEKIAKAKSEKFETMSGQYNAEAEVTKLQSAFANYSVRMGMYYVCAPQSGYITKATKSGIGETIYQGEEILTIMPEGYDLAAELYIAPRDLPLVEIGTKVRLVFDGWPAMVFSGWPGVSSGTFGGTVIAIDKFANAKGQFRMLVIPSEEGDGWPQALRVGSGVKGMALLKDVPVWYEIWRQLNGFPPEFYRVEDDKAKNGKNPKIKIQ